MFEGIEFLEDKGVEFFDNRGEEETPINKIDAWRLLRDGAALQEHAIAMHNVPTSVSGALYVNSAEELKRAVFFEFQGPDLGLAEPEAAEVLRDLGVQGVGLNGWRSPKATWEKLIEEPQHRVQLSFGKHTVGEMGLADFRDPGSVAGDIPDLAQFYGGVLAPRVESDNLYEGNAGSQLGDLHEDLQFGLRADSLDENEYQSQRSHYLKLAHQAKDVGVAREAWELVGFEIGETKETRLQVMGQLLAAEEGLGVLPGEEPEEGYIATSRALDDYKLLLTYRNRDESLEQTTASLVSILETVAPEEGWDAAREAFVYLQKGAAKGLFDGKAAREAFLERFLLTLSSQSAREHLDSVDLSPSISFQENLLQVGEQSVGLKG